MKGLFEDEINAMNTESNNKCCGKCSQIVTSFASNGHNEVVCMNLNCPCHHHKCCEECARIIPVAEVYGGVQTYCRNRNCPNCHQNHKGKCTECQFENGEHSQACSRWKPTNWRKFSATPHQQWEEQRKNLKEFAEKYPHMLMDVIDSAYLAGLEAPPHHQRE